MTSALATVPWGTADMIRFVRDVDSGWWKQAVEEHNKRRKSPRSSKYINLSNPTLEALVTSQGLLGSATQASERAKSGTSKALLAVVHFLNKHSKALDVFVNTTPVAAFVWGPVRVFLEAITDGSETSDIVAEGVCQVLKQFDRWRELSILSAVSDRAQHAAVHLYIQVLDFLQSAKKHYGDPTLNEWTIAVLDSRKDKFSGKLAKVKEAASELEKEIRFIVDPERTILLQEDDSHASLALKCLSCLMDNQYAAKARIAQLLRANFNEPALTTGIFLAREAMSYEYAARHWGYHLSKVVSPEPELLSIANEFLHSFQSVYWGEFAYRLARGNQSTEGTFSIIRADYGYLQEWFAKLSEESKSQIGIDDFFIVPYERISKSWATPPEDDKVLPWMPLIRLGDYCWEMALVDEGIRIRREARNGCIETLGPRHPLTLRSRSDMCQVFMIEGRYLDALVEYNAVVDGQRDVLGSDNPAVCVTLSHRGITEFLVTRFDGAIQSETEASRGLLRLEGPESARYIVSQWILTWPLSYTGDYQKALEICQDLYRRRREKHGCRDEYALLFTMVMGELFRKLNRMEESIQRLEEAFDVQRQALSGSISQNIGLLDPAINLVVSYRDSGQNDKAWKLISEIEGPEAGLPDRFHDRQCQIAHVKGLLLSDEGRVNAAISLLQGFFVKIDRDQYNRAVLWLLVDLAAMLRGRGEEGDEDQALINFQNILRKTNPREADSSPIEVIGNEPGLEEDLTSEGEPDPPGLLRDAEHALTLVRNLKFAEAEMFLAEKQVEWYRQRDFWVVYGAVPADTTTMKPPSLEVMDEFIPISYPKMAKKCSLRQKPTHSNESALQYYHGHIFPIPI